jgi:hypothetical protein
MGLGGVDANLDVYTALYTAAGSAVETQALAGDKSVTVNLTSIPQSVGDVTAHQVAIAGGSSYATAYFHAASIGSASVTASAVGYQPNSVQAAVQASTLRIDANGLTIGNFLEAQGTVYLSAPAPSGGLAIRLTSNSSLLELALNANAPGANSIVVNVPQNVSVGTYYVYALGSSGTATYSASAPGYVSSGDDTVTLAPSGIVVYPLASTTMGVGGSSTFALYTAQLSTDGMNWPMSPQSLAGAATLNVLLTNSNHVVGILNGSSNATPQIPIAPGTSGATVTFTAVASGSTTVSVTQPAGWTAAGSYSNGNSSQQLGFLVF